METHMKCIFLPHNSMALTLLVYRREHVPQPKQVLVNDTVYSVADSIMYISLYTFIY